MRILGLHCVGHDTGAALVEDGEVRYSMETERLTRRRFDDRIDYSLDHVLSGDADIASVDVVALSTPLGHPSVEVTDAETVMKRLARRDITHVHTTCRLRGRTLPCVVVTHEASHAMLAAHYARYSPGSLVLVNEGRGQFSQNALFRYSETGLEWLETDPLPWYARGLGWTGLGVLFGMGNSPGVAGKLMAMSGYGRFDADVAARLRAIDDAVTTDRAYAEEVARDLHADEFATGFDRQAVVTATFQEMFTQQIVELLTDRMTRYGCQQLALGGGCALNIVTNTALRNRLSAPLSIPPACGDAGHPLGAACYAYRELTGEHVAPFPVYVNGTAEASDSAARTFRRVGLAPEPLELDRVVRVLASGGVVAWQQGRAESGPRALGHRSLLADPNRPGMRQRVSEQLKDREWYRPLGAILTEESASRVIPNQPMSPHMLFNYDLPEQVLPEARHVDGTSRLQTLGRTNEPLLHDLLTRFSEATGVPGLINTSLNAAGKAIAQSCDNIMDDFHGTPVSLFVSGEVMAEQEIP